MTKTKNASFFKKNEGNIFSSSQNKNLKKLKLKIGDISVVTITALGTKNVGLAEISNGYTVIVPKAKLGETVKVQIEKISLKPKYATAKLVEVIKETKITVPVKVDDLLEVVIEKQGPQGSGLHSLSENFTIIVEPKSKQSGVTIGDKINVTITRIKEKYAFAKLVENPSEKEQNVSLNANRLNSALRMTNGLFGLLTTGSKFNVTLPLNAKCLGNYAIIKLKNSLVFVKMGLGAQLGETVRIQIVKTTSQYSIAKITKINPLAKNAKQLLIKNNVKK